MSLWWLVVGVFVALAGLFVWALARAVDIADERMEWEHEQWIKEREGL